MPDNKIVRTRFAPSPTGFLHVGGLRTALYAYLLAKKNNGQFLLRIEDTDQKRSVDGAVEAVLRSLRWASIQPDEGVVFEAGTENISSQGDCGPYVQSQRLELYKKHADELIEKGYAYYCFCSSERLEELRNFQQKNNLPPGYDGNCRSLNLEEITKKMTENPTHTIRLKMPKEGETKFQDLIRGEVVFKNELIDDQVLVKSDGFPTYHLAVVVDDHLMEITHATRAEEWLSSTPKHIQLYKYFGWEIPEFGHLPQLVNKDRSKLSKRQGDVAVEDYIKKGYLPEAMVNFVAFLGWNPGTEKEMYSLEELIQDFSLEKVGKSGSYFNLEKLDWYNQQYIKKLSNDELALRAKHWFDEAGMGSISSDKLASAIGLEKERVVTLSELPEAVRFVFELPDYDGKILIWKKSSIDEVKNVLPKLKDFLSMASIEDWKKDILQTKIGEWVKENGLTNGSVLWPMRVALSGHENSPGPFEIAEVIGRDEVIERLEIALKKVNLLDNVV